jgi:hypothetical protein
MLFELEIWSSLHLPISKTTEMSLNSEGFIKIIIQVAEVDFCTPCLNANLELFWTIFHCASYPYPTKHPILHSYYYILKTIPK